MSDCPADEELALFLDGALSGSSAGAIRLHMASCASCASVATAGGGSLDPAATRLATVPPKPLRVGRYVLVRHLGSGTMGSVFLATDEELRRSVAVKLMHAAPLEDPARRLERFQHEARAMARLAHPNVVAIHDVGLQSGAPFIAMAWVKGETLRAWLARAPRSIDDIVAIFVQAGRGLAAAHECGLIHRDFKPDNVLVTAERDVKVTDFGLAKLDDRGEPFEDRTHILPTSTQLTSSGVLAGTPAYMAPEQFRGEGATAASDQYAFSLALYEALLGQPIFLGTFAELDAERRAGAMPSIALPQRVPSWLRRAVVTGLAVDVSRRHASMAAFVQVLEHELSVRWRPSRLFARRGFLLTGAVLAGIAATGAALEARGTPAGRPFTSDPVTSDPAEDAAHADLSAIPWPVDAGTPVLPTRSEIPSPVTRPARPHDAKAASRSRPTSDGRPPSVPLASPECTPPYFVDSAGHREFKPECL